MIHTCVCGAAVKYKVVMRVFLVAALLPAAAGTRRTSRLGPFRQRVPHRGKHEEAMALDMARLNTQDVAVDPEAVAAYEEELAAAAAAAEESDEDEDDPNDDRPLWQKRIDKADGIKRTKNGTPIINHGPIGGGGGGPPQRN